MSNCTYVIAGSYLSLTPQRLLSSSPSNSFKVPRSNPLFYLIIKYLKADCFQGESFGNLVHSALDYFYPETFEPCVEGLNVQLQNYPALGELSLELTAHLLTLLDTNVCLEPLVKFWARATLSGKFNALQIQSVMCAVCTPDLPLTEDGILIAYLPLDTCICFEQTNSSLFGEILCKTLTGKEPWTGDQLSQRLLGFSSVLPSEPMCLYEVAIAPEHLVVPGVSLKPSKGKIFAGMYTLINQITNCEQVKTPTATVTLLKKEQRSTTAEQADSFKFSRLYSSNFILT